jgi:hypothetical protein
VSDDAKNMFSSGEHPERMTIGVFHASTKSVKISGSRYIEKLLR